MLEITLKSPYQFAHILFQPTIVPIISEDSEGFVIPHGDHNHYIKVQTKGYEAALKNKIPSLQSNYQPGTFDEKAVLAKVDQLLADSRSIYKDRLS